MDNGGISDDELRRFREYSKLRQQASKDLSGYAKNLKGIAQIKEQIVFFEQEIQKFHKQGQEFLNKELELKEEIREAQAENNEEKLKELRLQELKLKANQEQNENNERLARAQLKTAQEMGEEMAKQVNAANALGAAYGSTLNVLVSVGKTIWNQTGHLLQQQKAVKMSELQMGILSNRSKDYQENLYNAALNTNIIGTSTKDLAEMQGTYAKEIGRTVLLTEEGHEAMAALSQGTVLGNENAARFAAQMEMFGHSVVTSKEFMEETLNVASKMGLAGNKVTENTMDALKLAERFNFANGVKGAAKMAMLTTKTRIELESIKGIAEKAFNPEGAIEMAANLSVLGGTWSQMADPFSLMFKARNDIEGLTEDIAKAASAGAEFNKETGEFDIASAQLHRLREVSNATGISLEELTRAARNAAKFSQIKANVTGNFDDEILDFISSTAQMGKDGKFFISMDGDKVFVDQLHNFTQDQLEVLAKERATLEERAKQSKTFDETWDNLKNQFKATLLPGFTVVADKLTKGLLDLSKWMVEEDILGKIQRTFKWVGDKLTKLIDWVDENPVAAGITAAGAGLAYVIGSNAAWLFRGQMLGFGFNSVAGGGLLGGGKGRGPGGGGGGWFGGGSKAAKAGAKAPSYRVQGGVEQIKTKSGKWINANSPQGRASATWRTRNAGRAASSSRVAGRGAGAARGLIGTGSKLLGVAGKMLGVVGTIVSLSSIAMDGYKNFQDETLTKSQALKKTADQNKGALIGAILGGAIGLLGGPAGVAMGAGIGSGLGSMFDGDDTKLIGDYGQKRVSTTSSYAASPMARPNMGQENQDFVSRPGQDPIPFSSADTLVGMKKGGGIDNFLSKKENSTSNKMDVVFKNAMKIEGKISLEGSNGQTVKIDLDDPILIRQLSRLVQEELTISLNGKRNPSPVN